MSKKNIGHGSDCCCAVCKNELEDFINVREENNPGFRELVEKVKQFNQLKEKVNHPSHYNAGEYEVIDVIEDWGFGPDFCAGNVIKYVGRYKHKDASLEDLKKARWYLDRLISFLEKKVENV